MPLVSRGAVQVSCAEELQATLLGLTLMTGAGGAVFSAKNTDADDQSPHVPVLSIAWTRHPNHRLQLS